MKISVNIIIFMLVPAVAFLFGGAVHSPSGEQTVRLCASPDCLTTATADDEPVSRGESKTFGKVRYSSKDRRVSFDGYVLMNDSRGEPMELIACARGGKTHESILAADIKPSDLHAALLEAGIKPSSYANRQAADRRDLLGNRAIVWIKWKENGQKVRHRAEDMLIDTRLGRPLGRWGWAFTGTYGLEDDPDTGNKVRVYRPNREKSLITNYHSPNTVLDNPRSIGAFDEIFVTNTPLIPGVKTKVTLIIEPATEERLVMDNIESDTLRLTALKKELGGAKKPEARKTLRHSITLHNTRIQQTAKLLEQAKKLDAVRAHIRNKLEPDLLTTGKKLEKALEKGDVKLVKKINSEFELRDAQLTAAGVELGRGYHYYYKTLAEIEAAEGKLRGVSGQNQAILEDEIKFYEGKEENVENELKLAKARFERLRTTQALNNAAGDEEKRLEMRIRLAELGRDEKILTNKIEVFHLLPEIAKTRTYINEGEKNIADALGEGDQELAGEYRAELENYKATLKYYQDMTKAKLLRAEAAKLECAAEIHKIKGEKAPEELLAELTVLDMKATLTEKKVERFKLRAKLKSVVKEIKLEIEIDGDPELIRQLQFGRAELEKRITSLNNEMMELEKKLENE